MIKTADLRIRGRVQGVGFRHFATQNAERYGISGYVKNCADGSVQVKAQGDEHDLSTFIDTLRSGPRSASVDELKIDWLDKSLDTHGFSVHF